jgi:hypothetical protein
MWYVVAAYDGERSFYNKCNWAFLGDVLARLYRYFVKIAIVTMQFIGKKIIWDVHVKQIINMFLGLGKESGGGDFKFG